MQRIIVAGLALPLALLASPIAWAGELEDLRAENARLRERVEQLERETARLRRIGPDPERLDEQAIAERVTVTTGPDGSTAATATLPLAVTAGSRADHELTLVSNGTEVRGTILSRFSGGIHAGVDEIVLDADDRSFRLPVVGYDVTRITTGAPQRRRRRDHERVTVVLPPDALAASADARSVGGVVGRVRFAIEPRDQATLRAFTERVTTP